MLDTTVAEDAVDFWSDPAQVDIPVEFLVHPAVMEHVDKFLTEHKMEYRVKVEDFSEMVSQEQRAIDELKDEFEYRDPSGRAVFEHFNFHNLNEVESYIKEIAAKRINHEDR